MSKKTVSSEKLKTLLTSTYATMLLVSRDRDEPAIELGLNVCAALSEFMNLSEAEMNEVRMRGEALAKKAIEVVRDNYESGDASEHTIQ